MAKRKAISTKARFEVFKRDGFTCQYCGATPPKAILHVDHIVPVAEGGGNEDTNLVTACDRCNLGKGARSLDQVPASLSDRAAEVAEREAQLRGYNEVMSAQRERVEAGAWEVADIFIDRMRTDGIRRDWFQSIKTFIERLGVHACIGAMEIAVSRQRYANKAFPYFCGICWNKIRENDNA